MLPAYGPIRDERLGRSALSLPLREEWLRWLCESGLIHAGVHMQPPPSRVPGVQALGDAVVASFDFGVRIDAFRRDILLNVSVIDSWYKSYI